ncbi:MAG: CtsR family transcriptional regulator [Chitinophagales bacterium]
MRSLSDKIEQYIKALVEHSDTNEVEIQRIELAETFRCVPSQITYVLATRFTANEGFLTQSKRGGKGFVRIKKIQKDLAALVNNHLDQVTAEKVIEGLKAKQLLTTREEIILKTIINRNVLDLPVEERDYVRFRIISAVVKLLEG